MEQSRLQQKILEKSGQRTNYSAANKLQINRQLKYSELLGAVPNAPLAEKEGYGEGQVDWFVMQQLMLISYY